MVYLKDDITLVYSLSDDEYEFNPLTIGRIAYVKGHRIYGRDKRHPHPYVFRLIKKLPLWKKIYLPYSDLFKNYWVEPKVILFGSNGDKAFEITCRSNEQAHNLKNELSYYHRKALKVFTNIE